MARAFLAGFLVLALAAGILAPAPAASKDPTVEVVRVDASGEASKAYGRLVDQPPVPQPAMRTRQDTPPVDIGPTADVEAERQRPTRQVTFYGHIFGLGLTPAPRPDGEFGPAGPQPANTIFPTGDANLGLGSFDWCSDVANFAGFPTPSPSPWSNCDTDPNNKIGLFLTAGPVQVHTPQEFVYSKLHNERGRTKDVVLDRAGSVEASIWMSLDYHAWSVGNGNDDTFCPVGLPRDVGCPYPYWGWDPAHWPQWVVEAKLYMVELGEYGQGASEPPPILESWAGGAMTLVAEGATPPADVQNGIPGSPNVHEFVVNLGNPLVDVIPKTHDVILVYNFYSLVNGQKVSAHTWRVWAGELFPARFTLPVKNALDVELVIPQFIHDKLLIHGVISSAWGSYDVDVGSATLTVLDGNTPVTISRLTRVGDYQVAHGAHFKPVNITWVWDYQADRLRPGTYKAVVEACNYQHSACEVTEAQFTINADGRPGPVVVGRSGQRTISEGQLQDLTRGNLGTQSVSSPEAPQPAAPHPQVRAPRAVPGLEAIAFLAALGGAALMFRRLS